MKILLIGEYSNVHATLAEGLRAIGHQVTVLSDGDSWKNYPRDIDASRTPGKLGGIVLMTKLWAMLPRLRGYDVVQLINPMFFELKAERLFFFSAMSCVPTRQPRQSDATGWEQRRRN